MGSDGRVRFLILAIANQKGGVAKTTTSINLAAALAEMGHRTLLIDLDPQTHASMGLGIQTDSLESSIYNALSERSDQKQFIENIIQPYGENFDVAPGHVLLCTIEQEFAEKEHAVGKLRHILQHMVFPYQFVVIDCPPSLGFLTFNALFAADLAVVPVELGTFALYGVGKLVSMIELIRVKTEHAPQVFALPTMVDMRSRFSRIMLERIRETFGEHCFETVIRANIACREAQQKGVPVQYHDPRAKASQDYRALAQEILAKLASDDDKRIQAAAGPVYNRVRDFTIAMPEAEEVYLVGDFNQWRVDETSKLWNQGKGTWQKRVLLTPGRYRYKFVIDGKWVVDPHNRLAEPNVYGGLDSVIEVP